MNIEAAADKLVEALLAEDTLPPSGVPTEERVGWVDLVELTNVAQFNTPTGVKDMWTLLGIEGLTMEDVDNNSQAFFDFIMRHAHETMKFHAKNGSPVQLLPRSTLRQQWEQELRQV